MIQLNYRDARPIYEQVKDGLRHLVVTGALQAGDKLPSVREYSLIFEVSPLTIQRAIQYLDNENVIYSKKGVGSFVAAEGRANIEDQMVSRQAEEFVRRMRNCGLSAKEIIELVTEVTERE